MLLLIVLAGAFIVLAKTAGNVTRFLSLPWTELANLPFLAESIYRPFELLSVDFILLVAETLPAEKAPAAIIVFNFRSSL